MTFTEICRHVFRQAITDYHQTDNVDSAMHNPYPEGDIKYELYTKEWIDTVQWHLEDIIRDPKNKTCHRARNKTQNRSQQSGTHRSRGAY